MGGRYYADDSEFRKDYFSSQFFSHSRKLASRNGQSPNSYFSRLTSFEAFKNYLQAAFSQDPSLQHYFEGMSNAEKRLFYNRPDIQRVVGANRKGDGLQKTLRDFPLKVQQVEGKTREFFTVYAGEKRTRGYASKVNIKGKIRTVYRTLTGRFARIQR